MLKWHQIQGLAGQTSQLVRVEEWETDGGETGQKEKSSYQLKSPSIEGFTDAGDQSYKTYFL